MRDQVIRYIRHRGLVKPGDRVLVAVSGGADSVALLRVLLELRAELGIVLAAAHLNHGLRGESSDADEAFVGQLAMRHKLDFFVERVAVAEHAETRRTGLESAGRKLRYEWLTKIAGEYRFDAVATAHTADDQAETVLMKFLRGAGSRGLGGIYPVMVQGTQTRFIRPLLDATRVKIEMYLESLGQEWREDESNLDRRFFRNRVRHQLLPLLEREYNPSIRQTLGELSEICRAEEKYWSELASIQLEQLRADRHHLPLEGFDAIPQALQRRVLKRWLEEAAIATDFRHIELLRGCALGVSEQTELAEGWYACAAGGYLALKRHEEDSPVGYAYLLRVPGEVPIQEIGYVLSVLTVPAGLAAESEPASLLRAELLSQELTIRNWKPGDRYWPAYSRSEEKLKRLFAERRIPVDERVLWPVVLKGEDIVAVRSLPVAEQYCWRPGDGEALSLQWTTVIKF